MTARPVDPEPDESGASRKGKPSSDRTDAETTRLRAQVAGVEALERHWRHLGACSALIPAVRGNAAVLTAMADALRDTLNVQEIR